MRNNECSWHFLYRRMSAWLLPYITQFALSDVPHAVCGNCKMPSSRWPTIGRGVPRYVDSYANEMALCEACLTLYESHIEVMGVERSAKGNPVPNKFGMWAGVAVLAESDSITLFMPKKITDKLPPHFPLRVVAATKAEMRSALLDREIQYPAVYVADLGKKKKELVASLEYSSGPENFVMCKADGNQYLNLNQIREARSLYHDLTRQSQRLLVDITRHLINGTLSPYEVAERLSDADDVKRALAAMGGDPYQRQFILRELS